MFYVFKFYSFYTCLQAPSRPSYRPAFFSVCLSVFPVIHFRQQRRSNKNGWLAIIAKQSCYFIPERRAKLKIRQNDMYEEEGKDKQKAKMKLERT